MRIIVLMHAAAEAAKAGHKFGPIRHFVTGSPNGGGAVGPFPLFFPMVFEDCLRMTGLFNSW